MNWDPDSAPVPELVAFKRQQLEARRLAREARTPSILDGFARAPDPAQVVAPVEPAQPGEPGEPVRCGNCGGKGTVPGLLHGSRFDCYLCDGTGFDLTDPAPALRYLLAENARLTKQHATLTEKATSFRAMWSESEIKERREREADRYFQAHHASRFD
ncbi:hypothetical protein ACEUCJ_15350 [Aeromonas rivipollensis]|uniref:hypothetical protein n=1 Tax=Aeromonas rivipollensis TaxID=948519 RepID=UPI0038D0FACD